MKTCDVLVIGAGIVGAACARAFARERMRVELVDAGVIGGGATAAGMGHLAVMDDSEALFALSRYSQELWEQMRGELPAEVEFDTCGSLWVAADDEEMQEVHRKQRFYESRGVPVEVLDAAALAKAEPNLRRGLAGGLRMLSDRVVYPPTAARWFANEAAGLGATVTAGVAVAKIEGDAVQLSDGSRIAAGVTVNATGAAAAKLTPGFEVRPRKGHLVITDRYPGFVHHQLIELGYLKSVAKAGGESVAFNVQPRRTGQLLIGSSRQNDDASREINASILAQMVRRALFYMPALASLSAIRTWTGFRAATPDKLPLIGPVPGQQRHHLATGHEGLGITTAVGTAELLVDEVLGRPSRIPQEPYLPARFDKERWDRRPAGPAKIPTGETPVPPA
jgi:D-hydroxyproline dehydrogenase subunit beta